MKNPSPRRNSATRRRHDSTLSSYSFQLFHSLRPLISTQESAFSARRVSLLTQTFNMRDYSCWGSIGAGYLRRGSLIVIERRAKAITQVSTDNVEPDDLHSPAPHLALFIENCADEFCQRLDELCDGANCACWLKWSSSTRRRISNGLL